MAAACRSNIWCNFGYAYSHSLHHCWLKQCQESHLYRCSTASQIVYRTYAVLVSTCWTVVYILNQAMQSLGELPGDEAHTPHMLNISILQIATCSIDIKKQFTIAICSGLWHSNRILPSRQFNSHEWWILLHTAKEITEKTERYIHASLSAVHLLAQQLN